ncbi:MAG TPA: gfo/Idh/MocA family oxidoreductase, partial [Candidatus Bathyarchaeota archaeon]|nr:gfo/Idh/MocA family oxidoreductase [Candidatus Bathyarchaeota archaeon]
MKKIRFGFVGVGRRGMTHLQVSRSIKEISVAALCDIDEKRVRTLAKSYKAKAYTDLKDMLENEDLDVAVISTPTRYHVSHAMACLSRGL